MGFIPDGSKPIGVLVLDFLCVFTPFLLFISPITIFFPIIQARRSWKRQQKEKRCMLDRENAMLVSKTAFPNASKSFSQKFMDSSTPGNFLKCIRKLIVRAKSLLFVSTSTSNDDHFESLQRRKFSIDSYKTTYPNSCYVCMPPLHFSAEYACCIVWVIFGVGIDEPVIVWCCVPGVVTGMVFLFLYGKYYRENETDKTKEKTCLNSEDQIVDKQTVDKSTVNKQIVDSQIDNKNYFVADSRTADNINLVFDDSMLNISIGECQSGQVGTISIGKTQGGQDRTMMQKNSRGQKIHPPRPIFNVPKLSFNAQFRLQLGFCVVLTSVTLVTYILLKYADVDGKSPKEVRYDHGDGDNGNTNDSTSGSPSNASFTTFIATTGWIACCLEVPMNTHVVIVVSEVWRDKTYNRSELMGSTTLNVINFIACLCWVLNVLLFMEDAIQPFFPNFLGCLANLLALYVRWVKRGLPVREREDLTSDLSEMELPEDATVMKDSQGEVVMDRDVMDPSRMKLQTVERQTLSEVGEAGRTIEKTALELFETEKPQLERTMLFERCSTMDTVGSLVDSIDSVKTCDSLTEDETPDDSTRV